MCINIWDVSLREASWSIRFDAIVSNSSINIVLGDMCSAISNMTLINFSESPRHFATSVLGVILKNVVLHSVATALASNVFPFKNVITCLIIIILYLSNYYKIYVHMYLYQEDHKTT